MIAQISFLLPSQLGSFSESDSLLVAQALTSKGLKLSPTMAKSLGANIPLTSSVSSLASIASSIPLECFNNTSPDNLVSLVGSMDLDNMDPFRKGFIASQIASSKNSSIIANLLIGTSDSSIVNSIPSYLFNQLNINVSSIPATNLPIAYVCFIYFFN